MKGHILVLLLLTGTLLAGRGQNQPVIPACEVIQSAFVLNNPPFRQCHASTLSELADGRIFAACFAGAYESAPDVKIWGSLLANGQWSEPFLLADGQMSDSLSYPCWNPVLHRTAAGRLYLFYKVGKNPREWFGMMKYSDNEASTWSDPLPLPEGALGPIKNKPLEFADGKLLCPSSTESNTEWKVQMEIFNPEQNSWDIRKVDHPSSFQVIQPTILLNPDSSIRILCRSKSNLIVTSLSGDQGNTWSGLSTISLPNPNSGIDAITLRDGSHLLVYNPLTAGKDWSAGRNRLNLAWSADGLTWEDVLILENQDSGEFSYPAIIQSNDGLIHLTYTYNRVQLRYWKVRIVSPAM